MSRFPTCKINVPKTLYHQDLVEAYRRPDVHEDFKVGDEFTAKYIVQRPEGFK